MKTLVLVADGGQARLFDMGGPPAKPVLAELAKLERPSAHLPGRALTTGPTGRVFDRAGRGLSGGTGHTRHGVASDYDPHAAEVDRFVRRLGRRLDEERRRGGIAKLILIAEPRFLGLLRPVLAGPTRKLVTLEIARDLVHADARGVGEAIARAWRQSA